MRGMMDIEQLADYLSTDPNTILRWTEEGKLPAPWTFDVPADGESIALQRWPLHVISEWLCDGCPTRKPLAEETFLRIRRDIAAGILAKRMANETNHKR